jgi:hypothetical protein
MIKTILKLFFSFILILNFTSCEEIGGALTGGLVIREPDNGELFVQSWVQVEVKCYEGDIVRVDCRGETEWVDCSQSDDFAYFDILLDEGLNTINVYGYDASGYQEDSDSVTVRCDTLAPVITGFSPPDGSTIGNAQYPGGFLAISGIVYDANGIQSMSYRGDNGLFGNITYTDNNWSIYINLSTLKDNTVYSLEFIAKDTAGRTVVEDYAFLYNSAYTIP